VFSNIFSKWRTNNALLTEINRSVHRQEIALSAQSEYMTTALTSLDVQMSNLQTRLAAEAAALAVAIETAQLSVEDADALNEAAARVQATADLVGTLAQPTAVADPDVPDVTADPLEPDQDAEPVI
jgi:hypothetical protein